MPNIWQKYIIYHILPLSKYINIYSAFIGKLQNTEITFSTTQEDLMFKIIANVDIRFEKIINFFDFIFYTTNSLYKNCFAEIANKFLYDWTHEKLSNMYIIRLRTKPENTYCASLKCLDILNLLDTDKTIYYNR